VRRRAAVLPFALVLALALAPGARHAAAACAPDQAQLVYDGGTSARTLPGYTIWQSFTPSVTGRLCRLEMGFFNDMSGEGLLEIREGEGTSGTVLQSLVVPVVGVTGGGATMNAWAIDVAVTAGSLYTFELTPDAATLPDPYGVAIGAGDPYPRGVMGIDDPSGSYPTPFDTNFRAHVDAQAAPAVSIYRSSVAQGLVAGRNFLGLALAPPFDDPNPLAVLNHYAADDGTGGPALIFVSKLPGGGVRITWN
jgi:hypothetical protein